MTDSYNYLQIYFFFFYEFILVLVLYCLSMHGIIRCKVDQNVKHSAVEIK